MEIKTFPKGENLIRDNENLQIRTYGRRITKDQTVYEYLLEFLLVFISEKDGKYGFDKIDDISKVEESKVSTNIALKRFIFLNNSKRENIAKADQEASNYLDEKIIANTELCGIEKDELLKIIRELYLGFTAFSGDRGWFAKSLLPITEEVIFPESMGKLKKRNSLEFNPLEEINIEIDTGFEFGEHNFMARGGEVYFLHLLQGFNSIKNEAERNFLKESLDLRLKDLVSSFPQFSKLSKWIQTLWVENVEYSDDDKKKLNTGVKLKWIPEEYERRSSYTLKELESVLKSDINTFEKFEIMSIGIVIQILRMMCEGANIKSGNGDCDLPWIIHILGSQEEEKIKKIAVENYKEIEEKMIVAISKQLDDASITKNTLLKKGHADSHKLLRKIGKDIGLVIPIKGANMRLSINDNIVKFLVVALINPGKKLTLSSFLKKMYEHFRIVIGPEEGMAVKGDMSCLQYNLEEFQIILRKNGFLRELSDSTSIVFNPYGEVNINE